MVWVKSEFARAVVEIDTSGNGPRLRVSNQQSGSYICLDALELDMLTLCTHAELIDMLAGAMSRCFSGDAEVGLS